MIEPFPPISRDEECKRILRVSAGPDRDQYEAVCAALNVQFKIIHNRAQVLLALCSVLISTSVLLMTGKIIGQRDFPHMSIVRVLLVGASVTEIAAAAIVVGDVLRVRWMSELPGKDLEDWLMTSLRYRDHKTRAYRVAIVLVLLAMAFFVAASTMTWLQL